MIVVDPGPGFAIYPVTFAEVGVQVQVNNVPATFDVSAIFVEALLHICLDAGLFERFGVG